MGKIEENKLNIVVLETGNCNAEDTLKVLIEPDYAKKTGVEGKAFCYRFPKMNVWVMKEPLNQPVAENALLRALKRRKATGTYWCDQLVVLRKAEEDDLPETTEFLVKKVIPALGRKATDRVVIGLVFDRADMPENAMDKLSQNFAELRKEIGKSLIAGKKKFQKQLEELTGKQLTVVPYALGKLILSPEYCLGFPFNVELLYEAIDVQIPSTKEEWFVRELSETKGNRSCYYEESGPRSEWAERFLIDFGKMLHRWERWYT